MAEDVQRELTPAALASLGPCSNRKLRGSRSPRSLAGKPLARFRATPIRRITDMNSIIIICNTFQNLLLLRSILYHRNRRRRRSGARGLFGFRRQMRECSDRSGQRARLSRGASSGPKRTVDRLPIGGQCPPAWWRTRCGRRNIALLRFGRRRLHRIMSFPNGAERGQQAPRRRSRRACSVGGMSLSQDAYAAR